MKIELKKRLAPSGNAEDFDVRQIKGALNRLGYYMPFDTIGMNGIPDQKLFDGIVKFQRDHGLDPSREIAPNDATVQALNKVASEQKGTYIWHTVNDDRVRAEHAKYNGTLRDWEESPDPTEDYNCRCWAELVESQKCFDGGNWKKRAAEILKDHEWSLEWPYLDTKELVTVGVGFNVDSQQKRHQVPYNIIDSSGRLRPALPIEIDQEYTKLRERGRLPENRDAREKFNVLGHFQVDWSSLRVSETWIEKELYKKINEFTIELERKFDKEKFNCFPSPARVALIDLIYSLGGTKFNSESWSGLFSAIKLRNWAYEC